LFNSLILHTSGSTSTPKLISHSKSDLEKHIKRSIIETKLSSTDTVLNVFPSNVIAYYTITAIPALISDATLISMQFDAYKYIEMFKKYKPTYIALIPRHIEILEKTKSWQTLDMSCVRYMVTGSQPVSQQLIDSLKSKGIQTVANWYGMTEMPPPVLVGYNSESFNFNTINDYSVEFSDDGECIIDGFKTGDIFDLNTKKFLKRKNDPTGQTWKTNI
jgi:acyl-coenzyme A synthetase/AMP-(fatty) acid ligase